MDQVLTVGTRRRCDNCPHFYTVKTSTHRFHSTKCRQEFHRFGSPLLRLRDRIGKEVNTAAAAIEMRVYSALDQQTRSRYAGMYPQLARHFDELLREQQAS